MNSYQKIIIYYFSGTGNSRNVATWISDSAKNMNMECELVNIGTTDRIHPKTPANNTLVIFISPIHGFNYPPLVINYIIRFPKGRNRVILMNTRAGMLIGKYITPGLTGVAFFLSSLILKLKGYSIYGMYPVDLPSNWISVHPGLNNRTVKFMHEKIKSRIETFAQQILTGKKNFKALREIIQDIAVSPISLGYYFIGRFIIAKTYFASSDCNGCDLCIKNCPVKAITKINGRPYWTFRCESCMHCMSYCPKKSIETGHGFVAGLILLYSIAIPSLYSMFDEFSIELKSHLLQEIIKLAIFLALTTLLYSGFHFMLRFKFFERLMVYTSLTKFKFWGRRYRALK